MYVMKRTLEYPLTAAQEYKETLRETAIALASVLLTGAESETLARVDLADRLARRLLANCGIYEPAADH